MNMNAESVRTSGFYSSKEWIQVRDFVRKRDKMTCQMCGDFTSWRNEVDHIIELNMENVTNPEIALNPENCQLLCFECHKRKTRIDKSGRNSERLFY